MSNTTTYISKENEIAILDEAISKLGTHSYLGPWLKEVRAELQQCITSDFFPQISIKHAEARAARIVECAIERGDSLVSSAEKQANKIVEQAKGTALSYHHQARQSLQRALNAL